MTDETDRATLAEIRDCGAPGASVGRAPVDPLAAALSTAAYDLSYVDEHGPTCVAVMRAGRLKRRAEDHISAVLAAARAVVSAYASSSSPDSFGVQDLESAITAADAEVRDDAEAVRDTPIPPADPLIDIPAAILRLSPADLVDEVRKRDDRIAKLTDDLRDARVLLQRECEWTGSWDVSRDDVRAIVEAVPESLRDAAARLANAARLRHEERCGVVVMNLREARAERDDLRSRLRAAYVCQAFAALRGITRLDVTAEDAGGAHAAARC